MKTYQEHLKSTLSFGETVSLTRKPVFRSSAIFPVLENSIFSTQILFMGYWLKKRNIPEVTILMTLRNAIGEIIHRKTSIIQEIKAYKISIASLLTETQKQPDDFSGSLELEVFSTRDMVFPYPAFVVNYISANGGTAVHTTGRIYNDVEDMVANASYKVPESGFDIYSGEENDPFFCFVNGSFDNSQKPIKYEIVDENQNGFSGEIVIPEIKPYQTCFVKLKDHIDIDKRLKTKKGTIKLHLNFEGFFPRIIAGNFKLNKAVSITHSFYDSSSVKDVSAYQQNSNSELHDSYIFIPLYVAEDFYTHLVYYPIYSPSEYLMGLHFYDVKGNLLKKLENWKSFQERDNMFFTIDINKLIEETLEGDQKSNVKGMMIANNWKGKNIPTRLKYGLNIGLKNRSLDLPTNICFAPEIANPKLLNKPGTFKWAPILNNFNSEIVITNCGPHREYSKPANIQIEYFRESDNEILKEEVWLLPYSQVIIDVKKFSDLKDFFKDETGWITITSDNPFVNAWYFDFNHATGVVAGDHSF